MSKFIAFNVNDNEIIEGVKNFDNKVCNQLYNKHKDYCLRYMNTMYHDADTNQDIYQDAIVVFIEKVRANTLNLVNTSIQTYLNAICRNQVLVRVNKKNKPVLMGDNWENDYSPKFTDWHDEQTEMKNDRINILMKELNVMKEKGQKCYELLSKVFFENHTMDQLAKVMNYTNADNAKSQSYKCRERLKKQVLESLQHGKN